MLGLLRVPRRRGKHLDGSAGSWEGCLLFFVPPLSLMHLVFILRNITPAELLFGKVMPFGSKLFELFELFRLQNE